MSPKQKKTLTRILISFVLTLALHLIHLEGPVLFFLYLIPYLIIGYDVLRGAVLGILQGQVFDENFLMAIATVGAMILGQYAEGVEVMLFFQVGAKISNPATPWKSELEIFQGILLMLGIGIREEVLYRGVITNAIARKYGSTTKGLWITVFSASAMFGAMHLSNMLYGVSFAGALTQAIGCIAGGVLFSAIYLRGGSIWVVALLHSLEDTPALLEMYFTNVAKNATAAQVAMMSSYRPDLTNVIVFVVQVLLAAFLLRKSKRQKIFDRIEQLKSSEMA